MINKRLPSFEIFYLQMLIIVPILNTNTSATYTPADETQTGIMRETLWDEAHWNCLFANYHSLSRLENRENKRPQTAEKMKAVVVEK